MKRICMILVVTITVFALSSCGSPMISETGFDLTDLETCVDGIVDENNISGCEDYDRHQLIEDYAKSFEGEFDTTDTNFNDSDFEFSSDKSSDANRLEYWFQYTMLDDTQYETHYEVYKEIIQTMSSELRAMNDHPEFLIAGEFFHMNGVHYKYFTNKDDELSGEIQVLDLTTDFATLFASFTTVIEGYAVDSELIQQELTVVSSDHSVEVIVDIDHSTYSYLIYNTNNEDTTTIAGVETLIETTFDGLSLTLEE